MFPSLAHVYHRWGGRSAHTALIFSQDKFRVTFRLLCSVLGRAAAEPKREMWAVCTYTEVYPNLCPEELCCSWKVWDGVSLEVAIKVPMPSSSCAQPSASLRTVPPFKCSSITGSSCAQHQREQLSFQAPTRVQHRCSDYQERKKYTEGVRGLLEPENPSTPRKKHPRWRIFTGHGGNLL